jgi:pilus assembly protein CpaD
MSSNRHSLAFRSLIVVSMAALACGCATAGKTKKADETPKLPTEQWSIRIDPTQDEILLAEHDSGLSDAQARAVSDLVERWRDAGGGPITIKEPSGGAGESYRSVAAVQEALESLGVSPDQIRIAGYDPDGRAGAPLMVGFTRYVAKGPECGRDWKSYTNTFENKPNNNFGCANTANIAAMIANPRDLIAPRDSDPSDAERRETVLTKYRAGQITSSAQDPQATGSVSAGASSGSGQ